MSMVETLQFCKTHLHFAQILCPYLVQLLCAIMRSMRKFHFFLDGEELSRFNAVADLQSPCVEVYPNHSAKPVMCARSFEKKDGNYFVHFRSVGKEEYKLLDSVFSALRTV